jgi:hypothetical protein
MRYTTVLSCTWRARVCPGAPRGPCGATKDTQDTNDTNDANYAKDAKYANGSRDTKGVADRLGLDAVRLRGPPGKRGRSAGGAEEGGGMSSDANEQSVKNQCLHARRARAGKGMPGIRACWRHDVDTCPAGAPACRRRWRRTGQG